MKNTSISLEEDNFAFLMQQGGDNRSAYINDLLRREQVRMLQEQIRLANIEEAADEGYLRELAIWDVASSDGLEA